MDFESFVLVAATTDLGDEPAAREHADAVEFRMDGADAPLESLGGYDGDLPIVATNRPTWEGGDAPGGTERLEALRTAVEHPAVEAVDVELESVESGEAEAVLAAARDHGTDVVVSTHDFEATPSASSCRSLLSRAGERGDVAKLATTAGSPGDVLDLLEATLAATRAGETVATMAMGEPGRHSRAVAPIYGSTIGYAPVDPERATAPGQFDLATLADLVELLE